MSAALNGIGYKLRRWIGGEVKRAGGQATREATRLSGWQALGAKSWAVKDEQMVWCIGQIRRWSPPEVGEASCCLSRPFP